MASRWPKPVARILLSALSARRGGGLTYLRHIVRAFPSGMGHQLSILSPRPIDGLTIPQDVEWARAPAWTARPISRLLFGWFYFRFLWPRRHDYNLAYFVGGSFDIALPAGVLKAVAFRNMLPFDPPSARRYPFGWIRFRHWMLTYVQGHAFRTANLVIFVSEYARQVIDSRVQRRGSAVTIPHGVAETTEKLDPVLLHRLPDAFVLYLSTIDVYKAHVELVDAWAILRQRRATLEKLVLAGPANPYYERQVRAAIAVHGLEKEVILLGEVRHDQVSDLATRAKINVFMSACENCPNIMLELMRAGQPMLISARQPMPELGGSELDYVDPYDEPAVADALIRLLDDPAHSAQVAAVGLKRSASFSWDEAGYRTWEAILAVTEE